MAPTYTFNFDISEQVEQTMVGITGGLRGLLEDLDSEVRGRLHEWTGEAQKQYEQHKAKWDAAAHQLPTKLGVVQKTLADIRLRYHHAEIGAGNTWGS